MQEPSKALAGAVTDRIWPCVMLQWEWLGGLPPVRRVAVIGAGTWGTSLAVCFARAGLEVDLGCRTHEQALAIASARENARYLPGVNLPESIRVLRAAELHLEAHDIVLPGGAGQGAAGGAGGLRRADLTPGRSAGGVQGAGAAAGHAALGVCGRALQRSRRGRARWSRPCRRSARARRLGRARLADKGFARQLADALTAAELDVSITTDVTGVELAGCAKNAAALAAAAAAGSGPNIAGAAAGKVFAEIDALARVRGSRPETFAGLAGAGDLVATVVATGSRNRRAGELLAQGISAEEIGRALGQTAEAVDSVPLLATRGA